MEKSDCQYQKLFAELEGYDRMGVHMKIDGAPASPMQIVSAHMLREDSAYMRDYILDEKGMVRELDFHRLLTGEDQNQKSVAGPSARTKME